METNNGGSEVSVYINSVTETNSCFYLDAVQISYLEDLKSGTIEVFDYYDTSKIILENFLTTLRATFFFVLSAKKASKLYSVPKLAPCLIVEPLPKKPSQLPWQPEEAPREGPTQGPTEGPRQVTTEKPIYDSVEMTMEESSVMEY